MGANPPCRNLGVQQLADEGVSATFPCWHILLFLPPSLQLPQLPQQLLGVPGLAGSRAAPPSPPELWPHVLQAHRWLAAGAGVDCPPALRTAVAGVRKQCHIRAVLARSRDSPPCGEGALATLEPGEPVLALRACSTAA